MDTAGGTSRISETKTRDRFRVCLVGLAVGDALGTTRIMEYIDGELLAGYATGKKQLRDREAVDVALDVLSALTAIHPDNELLHAIDEKKREGEITAAEYDDLMSVNESALVHRDIKP